MWPKSSSSFPLLQRSWDPGRAVSLLHMMCVKLRKRLFAIVVKNKNGSDVSRTKSRACFERKTHIGTTALIGRIAGGLGSHLWNFLFFFGAFLRSCNSPFSSSSCVCDSKHFFPKISITLLLSDNSSDPWVLALGAVSLPLILLTHH